MTRAIVAVAFLIGWQVVAGLGLNAYYLSTPLLVAHQIFTWCGGGTVWPHLFATMTSMIAGFLISASFGTGLAVMIASFPFVGKVLAPFLTAAFATPKIVVAPLLILWVGVGHAPVIALAALSSFFIVFYNAYSGLQDVPRSYIDTAALLGAGRWTTALRFRLPAAGPHILAGLQQGLIYAFHGAVLGEMTSSDTGMGYVIVYAATSMDSTAVIAGLCIIGAVSFTLIRLLQVGTSSFEAPLTFGPIA